MSEQSSVEEGEARAAEIRRDVEAAEARQSDEDVAAAAEHVADATKEQEKLSRRARRKHEKAEKAAVAAQAAREQADKAQAAAQAEAERRRAEAVSSVSGASVSSPGIGASTPPHAAAAANAPWPQPGAAAGGSAETPLTERPEVLIGAAFVGSFIFARVLKRLVD
jgi:hypothetical protein